MANDQAKVVSAVNRESVEARRDVLRKMGLFAAYSTPVVLGVLTPKKAMAASNHGNNGFGNGGNDGVPGNSGFPDTNR